VPESNLMIDNVTPFLYIMQTAKGEFKIVEFMTYCGVPVTNE